MAEYARLQKKMSADEEERLARERLDVQRMKLQLMARSEERGVRSDTNELFHIKREIARLMESEHKPNTAALAQQIRNNKSAGSNGSNGSGSDKFVLRTDNVNGWVGPSMPLFGPAPFPFGGGGVGVGGAAASALTTGGAFNTFVPLVLTASDAKTGGSSASVGSSGGAATEFTVASDQNVVDRELHRLQSEKDELLATEVYDENHVLVRSINQRMAQLQKLRGGSK